MPPSSALRAKIHIARKELAASIGLTDDAYRDILQLNWQAKSSSDLNDSQATELINIFKAKGWVPKKQTGTTRQKKRDGRYIEVKPGPAAKQQQKILAMWNELGYGMDKLHARVKKQFSVDRFEWLEDGKALHVLITDLQQRLDSKGIKKNEPKNL